MVEGYSWQEAINKSALPKPHSLPRMTFKSSDPSEIWKVCHELRRCLSRDLKIFDRDEDEAIALRRIRERFKELET